MFIFSLTHTNSYEDFAIKQIKVLHFLHKFGIFRTHSLNFVIVRSR